LAARYFYESEQTAFGLAFLETMIKGAKNPAVKRHYELRRDALLAVMAIEEAQNKYLDRFDTKVVNLQQLVVSGVLDFLPADPYGGTFYLDDHGKVRSTSKFASSDQ
jgi:hypothetical protein